MTRGKSIGLVSIAFFLVLIGILAILNIPTAYEYSFLLAVLNTIFLGLFPVAIALIIALVFLRRGTTGLLLIGSGLLLFGLGSIVAGWVNPLPGGPNLTVTIHNICACIGGALVFSGCLHSLGSFEPFKPRYRDLFVVGLYGVAVIVVLALILALFGGLLPSFMVPGTGFTPIRQVVLENAILFFGLSSLILLVACRKHYAEFISWYAIAFGLISVGLLAVLLQPSVGSLIGWTGRLAQYLGCTFAMYAVILAQITGKREGTSLENILLRFYQDPRKIDKFSTQVLDSINDGIAIIRESDGNIVYANPRFNAMFGYTQGELLGKNIAVLNSPVGTKTQEEITIGIIHGLGEKGEWHGDICNVKKDGVRLWTHADITSFYHEDFGRVWITTQTDITQEKKAEKALHDSEQKYRMLVENSVDYIVRYDRNHRYLYLNPAAVAISGFQESDLLGKTTRQLLGEGELSTRWEETLESVFLTGKNARLQFTWPTKDGPRILDLRFTPEYYHKGQVESVLGVSRDITEQKQAEEAIRKANRQLTLLGSITRHDIINKITSIKGYLGIIDKKFPDQDLSYFTTKIFSATDMIESQIAFTKVYQELGSQDPQWQDIDAIISRLSFPETINLKSDITGVKVFADPMLEKVFYNLLDNSIRHGEYVTEIQVSYQQVDQGLKIIWDDNGIGVPPEEKERIFERGFGKNSGLGLFLTREILSLTDISIAETGVPGKGARFEITVPKGIYKRLS